MSGGWIRCKSGGQTRLREAARECGVSIDEVAFMAGCSRSCAYSWSRGASAPSVYGAIRVAEALGLPVGYLWRLDP